MRKWHLESEFHYETWHKTAKRLSRQLLLFQLFTRFRENIPTKDYFKFHREIRILSTICALITRLHYPPPLGPHPHYIWFNIIVLNSRKAVYNTTLKIIFYIQGYICNILPFVDQMIWPVLSQFGG